MALRNRQNLLAALPKSHKDPDSAQLRASLVAQVEEFSHRVTSEKPLETQVTVLEKSLSTKLAKLERAQAKLADAQAEVTELLESVAKTQASLLDVRTQVERYQSTEVEEPGGQGEAFFMARLGVLAQALDPAKRQAFSDLLAEMSLASAAAFPVQPECQAAPSGPGQAAVIGPGGSTSSAYNPAAVVSPAVVITVPATPIISKGRGAASPKRLAISGKGAGGESLALVSAPMTPLSLTSPTRAAPANPLWSTLRARGGRARAVSVDGSEDFITVTARSRSQGGHPTHGRRITGKKAVEGENPNVYLDPTFPLGRRHFPGPGLEDAENL